MTQYKITGRRNTNVRAIKDSRGKVIWDGKAKTMQLTYGAEKTMKFMFESMKNYVDKSEWTLKLIKIR